MARREYSPGPGLASARKDTEARARAEQIARAALDDTLKAHFHAGEDGASNRATARHVGISDSYLRDIRSGNRTVALWEVLCLPRRYAEEVLRRCLSEVGLIPSHVPLERAHRQLVAQVGALSATLDAALLDGTLDDGEKAHLASLLRQLGARADQAALDAETG